MGRSTRSHNGDGLKQGMGVAVGCGAPGVAVTTTGVPSTRIVVPGAMRTVTPTDSLMPLSPSSSTTLTASVYAISSAAIRSAMSQNRSSGTVSLFTWLNSWS